MFLDPDPRRQNLGSSPFFSSQTPIVSPRERREREQRTKRKPLHERTPSQNNQQRRAKLVRISSHSKQTVRLVGKSPARRSSERSRKSGDRSRKSSDRSDRRQHDSNDENSIDLARRDSREEAANEVEVAQPRLSLSLEQKAASASKPGFEAASSVSEAQSSTGRDQQLDLPHNVSHPSPTAESGATEQRESSTWHRRSNSSTSATLRESEAADTSFTNSDNSRLGRVSDAPTLRDTPPLEELELSKTHDSGNLLPDDPELFNQNSASPKTSTVRAVLPSSPGASRDDLDRILRPRASESSLPQPSRPRSYPERDVSEQPSFLSRQDSQGSSTGSIPLPSPSRRSYEEATSPTRRLQTQDSFNYLRYSYPPPSSPNCVAFSDSSRPFPYGQDTFFSTRSYESIQSRLDSPVVRRPDTGRSVATNNTWASRQRSSSADTLPPLQIPRKRVRGHKGSLSAGVKDMMDYPNPEEVDTQPWPRAPFSSHLSTIASESSRSASRQLSHFSLGSGVMTPDYASSIPMSASWSQHQRESGPLRNSAAESSRDPPSSEEEPGDMTMGVFRAESAKPEPLFRGRQMSAPDTSARRYDGPLPPIPPIPMDGESSEHVDVLSELSAPPLRQKRSGYSVRARSNSTPSGSHSRHQSQVSNSESERWSQGSFLFPVWAKNFYAGNAALLSASKISLSNPPTPRPKDGAGAAPTHERNGSTWTERSITSRLGTGYSELQSSPTSSSFLPSIFRPRTRTNPEAGMSSKFANKFRRSKSSKSKASRPSQSDSSRPDSLAIFQDPFDPNHTGETLPSGQPKYGTLKDQSDVPPVPRLPRKYSKQKQWDNMEFPRPMTKDRLSEFHMDDSPHLGPSTRQSNRLSAWRTPSFVESLDTLFNSRGNRQILLFCLGFIFPFFWLLGAILPLPPRPGHDAAEAEKALPRAESEDDLQAALRRHTAGDASKRWSEERTWLKAKWWRTLNRIMCFVGVGVIAAVIALAVVATR